MFPLVGTVVLCWRSLVVVHCRLLRFAVCCLWLFVAVCRLSCCMFVVVVIGCGRWLFCFVVVCCVVVAYVVCS